MGPALGLHGSFQADVASFESEKAAATAQREKDNKAFIAESTDYGESVDALDRAIVVPSPKQNKNYMFFLNLAVLGFGNARQLRNSARSVYRTGGKPARCFPPGTRRADRFSITSLLPIFSQGGAMRPEVSVSSK